MAPGPGRFAAKFTRIDSDAGMQNTAPSVIGRHVPSSRFPAGTPFSSIRRTTWPPFPPPFTDKNAPGAVCPGQNRDGIPFTSGPTLAFTATGPVDNGPSVTGNTPASDVAAFPPGACSPTSGGQSFVNPCEFRVVHAWPFRAPQSHVPVRGFVGLGGAPPPLTTHFGHGCTAAVVKYVAEFSATRSVPVVPVVGSNVPLTASRIVFSTHDDVPAFGIGSGVPNGHPTSVQSTPAGNPAACVGPTVHPVALVHVNRKRFVAPSGVMFSSTVELPPPMFSPPHDNRPCTTPSGVGSRRVTPHFVVPPVVLTKSK